jgi:hypothetical protein
LRVQKIPPVTAARLGAWIRNKVPEQETAVAWERVPAVRRSSARVIEGDGTEVSLPVRFESGLFLVVN